MYLFFSILFLILLFFFCINHWRKKKIIKKICCLTTKEKCNTLNELIEPFGYSYIVSQDIFTSRFDAWQRDFGYCYLYDKTAVRFGMVFDCLPVYFNYDGRTWLIEFWKGQYGINTGGEIGIYYADRILKENELKTTLFHCAADKDILGLSFNLFKNGMEIANVCAKHWWLTAFSMGRFSEPIDLYMYTSITFPNHNMANAFMEGLIQAGYCGKDIYICCDTVTFSFSHSFTHPGMLRRIRIRIAQSINHFGCRLFLFVTRPFCLSLDRILYLYYYIPFIFRKMFRIRKFHNFKIKRR